MTTASTDVQGTYTHPTGADTHPAIPHLNDARRILHTPIRGWIHTANELEAAHTNRLAIPVLATVLGIFGATIIGVNL